MQKGIDVKEMVSALDIGEKVRNLRKERGMTLQALSKTTGLSIPLLSQVENEAIEPPIHTLMKIAKAFEVRIGHFFEESEAGPKVAVVTNDEKRTVERRAASDTGYHYSSLAFKRNLKLMDPYLVEFEPRSEKDMKLFDHFGEEFMYVLDGKLELRRGPDVFNLKRGDSIYFDSDEPHGFRGLNGSNAKAIVVVCHKAR